MKKLFHKRGDKIMWKLVVFLLLIDIAGADWTMDYAKDFDWVIDGWTLIDSLIRSTDENGEIYLEEGTYRVEELREGNWLTKGIYLEKGVYLAERWFFHLAGGTYLAKGSYLEKGSYFSDEGYLEEGTYLEKVRYIAEGYPDNMTPTGWEATLEGGSYLAEGTYLAKGSHLVKSYIVIMEVMENGSLTKSDRPPERHYLADPAEEKIIIDTSVFS